MAIPITPTRDLSAEEFALLQQEMQRSVDKAETAERIAQMKRVFDAITAAAKKK